MRSRFQRALAIEAPEALACILVFAIAFGVWRLTGLGVKDTGKGPDGGVVDPPRATESQSPPPPPKPLSDAGKRPASTAKHSGPLNVVLITVDTLRWDLGFMGYPRPVSPNIDALAKRAVVYEHAYATASYTMKCLAPLLIGRYSSETVRDFGHYTTFGPANVFLAERIHDGGGRSFAATTHHYFRTANHRGFEQGFDVWDTSAIPVTTSDNETAVTSQHLSDAAIALLGSPNDAELPIRPKGAGAAAAAPSAGTGRFFAWFHYLDPHSPYVTHEGAPIFATMADSNPANGLKIPRERALYDGEVWFTDKQIGRVLDHIAAQPWANETAIILTADHGEAFGERGHWKHGRELWEPLVRVPLIVYIPGVAPRRIDVKRSHIDIVPTILELMEIPKPTPEKTDSKATLRGKSLVPELKARAGTALEERDVFLDMPEGQLNEMRRGIITGKSPGLKLIDMGNGVGAGRYELFDLATDPGETQNLSSSDPDRLRDATTAMQKLRGGLEELPSR